MLQTSNDDCDAILTDKNVGSGTTGYILTMR